MIALSLHEGEGVWRAVGSVLFGVFGVLAYAVGPIVLALAVMLAYGKKPPIPRSVKVGALFVAVSGALCVFGDYRCANGKFVADIAELYRRGSLVEGGGAMSALLGWPLEVSCGLTAAKILIILIIFVCVMLLTGRTIADLMNTLRKPIDKIKNVHEEHAFAAAAESADSESDAAPWEGTPKPSLFRRKKIDIPIGPPSDESSAMGGIEENNTDFKTDETLKKEPEILASRESAVTSEPERVRCCVDEHGSRIDIPLGPEFDPSSDAPVDDDEVITRDAAPCGPAAEVVDEVFRRQQMMETLFTDFKDSADDRSASAPNTNPEPIVATPQPEPEPEFFSDVPTEYRFPPVALLDKPKAIVEHVADDEMRSTADSLVSTLKSFGVSTKIIDYSRGPTVTRYELQPEPGVRLSRIVNLSDDLALNLAADGVRIEAPIPGKAAVGVEVPNKTRSAVKLRSVIESDEFKNASSPLSFAIGKDIAGKVKIGDISKMPHLLIAGATGMGKSVCINSIIMSLVY
ncbi:MAG: DNA translocase FtsK, partial [Oscillospiraceae bacterium]